MFIGNRKRKAFHKPMNNDSHTIDASCSTNTGSEPAALTTNASEAFAESCAVGEQHEDLRSQQHNLQDSSVIDKTVSPEASKAKLGFNHSPRAMLVGIILTLMGGALWGTNATVSKILMSDYRVSPLQIACVRQLAAGLLFLILAAICTPRQLVDAVKTKRSYGMFVLTAIVCVLLTQVSYLWAIDWTNSGTATVLQSLNLLFVLFYVCVRARRAPSLRENIGVILAFVGTSLMATGGDFSKLSLPLMGLIWGLVDALSTAALSIMPMKMIVRWGNIVVNGIAFTISGLLLLPVVQPWATMPSLDWRGIALFTFTVVGGTFGAYWLFLSGVLRVGSVKATLLGASEPVMAAVTAVAFTGAVFSWADVVGFVLIFIMMTLLR